MSQTFWQQVHCFVRIGPLIHRWHLCDTNTWGYGLWQDSNSLVNNTTRIFVWSFLSQKSIKHTKDPETTTTLKVCFYKFLLYRALLTIPHLLSISLTHLKPMFKIFWSRQAAQCISVVQLNALLKKSSYLYCSFLYSLWETASLGSLF